MRGDAPIEKVSPSKPIPKEGEVRLRVRYSECDPMGVAHHSACIPWFELGRTELLREGGLTYAHMEQAGILLVVTRLEIRYKAPARYDDLLVLETRVTGGSRARIDHAYELWSTIDGDGAHKGDLLVTGSSTLAHVDRSGKPRALPDWLRADAHG